MGSLETISIGFDIATAVSIIGAVIVFIINTRKENKKIIGEERENERVKILSGLLTTYRKEYLFPILDSLGKRNPDAVAAKKELEDRIESLIEFLKRKALPIAAIYSGEDDFNAILEMKELSYGIGPKMHKILSGGASQEGNASEATRVLLTYRDELIDLEVAMVKRLRGLTHNEPPSKSEEISDMYAKHQYGRGKID